jgi:hypothetical protein
MKQTRTETVYASQTLKNLGRSEQGVSERVSLVLAERQLTVRVRKRVCMSRTLERQEIHTRVAHTTDSPVYNTEIAFGVIGIASLLASGALILGPKTRSDDAGATGLGWTLLAFGMGATAIGGGGALVDRALLEPRTTIRTVDRTVGHTTPGPCPGSADQPITVRVMLPDGITLSGTAGPSDELTLELEERAAQGLQAISRLEVWLDERPHGTVLLTRE